jgi:hypothetical protein
MWLSVTCWSLALDLLACLYGVYSVLMLHFAQEEETFFTLSDDEPASDRVSTGLKGSETQDGRGSTRR